MMGHTNETLYDVIDKWVETLAKQFFANEISLETALILMRQRLNVALKIDKKLAGKIYNVIGAFNFEQGYYEEALQSFSLAKQTYEVAEHPDGIASGLNNIGEIHRARMQYEAALVAYQVAGQIALEYDLATQYAYSSANEAFIHMEMGNFEKAQTLYQDCLAYATDYLDSESAEYKRLLPEVYMNLARIFANLQEFEAAHNYIHLARLCEEATDNLSIIGSVAYTNLEICYHAQQSTKDALKYYEASFLAFSQMQAKRQLVDLYLLWAAFCERDQQFQDARVAYQCAIKILEQLKLKERLREVKHLMEALYERITPPTVAPLIYTF